MSSMYQIMPRSPYKVGRPRNLSVICRQQKNIREFFFDIPSHKISWCCRLRSSSCVSFSDAYRCHPSDYHFDQYPGHGVLVDSCHNVLGSVAWEKPWRNPTAGAGVDLFTVVPCELELLVACKGSFCCCSCWCIMVYHMRKNTAWFIQQMIIIIILSCFVQFCF